MHSACYFCLFFCPRKFLHYYFKYLLFGSRFPVPLRYQLPQITIYLQPVPIFHALHVATMVAPCCQAKIWSYSFPTTTCLRKEYNLDIRLRPFLLHVICHQQSQHGLILTMCPVFVGAIFVVRPLIRNSFATTMWCHTRVTIKYTAII